MWNKEHGKRVSNGQDSRQSDGISSYRQPVLPVSLVYLFRRCSVSEKMQSCSLPSADVDVNNVSNILDTITNLIPSNPFASFVNGDMLSILVFAVIIGFAILALQEKAQPLMDLITSVNEVSMKILYFMTSSSLINCLRYLKMH